MSVDTHVIAIRTQLEALETQHRAVGRTIGRLHKALAEAAEAYAEMHGHDSPALSAAIAPKTPPRQD